MSLPQVPDQLYISGSYADAGASSLVSSVRGGRTERRPAVGDALLARERRWRPPLDRRRPATGTWSEYSVRTLLIDNYDSYTYNLFHLLGRANGEEPHVLTNDVRGLPDLHRYDNIVISPGPGRPERARDFGISMDVLRKADLPILGVCLGHQGLAVCEGGEVVPAPTARHGHLTRVTHGGEGLFAGIPPEFGAVRYHSLCVAEPLPKDLHVLARSEDGVVQALGHRRLPRWGVQFHPESVETEHGQRVVENFRDLTRASRPRGPASTARRRTGTATGVGKRPSETHGETPSAIPSAIPSEAPTATVAAGVGASARAHQRHVSARPGGESDIGTVHYRLHVREIGHAVDTEAAFQTLYGASNTAFWLDSARAEPGLSRFSFLGDTSGPLAETVRYRLDDGLVTIDPPPANPPAKEPVLDYLQRELRRREIDAPALPFDFTGGYIGYFGYELKADCGSPNRHRARTPDAVWLFADRFLAVDHFQNRTYLLALSERHGTGAAAERWLDRTATLLGALAPLPEPQPWEPWPVEPFLARDRATYTAAVDTSREYLLAGESYEVCLTNSAEFPATDGGWETYRRLRRLNPAPYAAYLRLDGTEVACSSPERFLSVAGDRTVEVKPIKGTAPRGATPAQDEAARAELVSSPKTRAENLMIADLLRNDLGRVCEVGSVEVPVLMAAESYATVHQLVSTIRGRLRADADAVDCVRACFPGGSMTGAPKPRTLEIIERLEGRARGIYSGSIGYLACQGGADLNVVIRTMVLSEGRWEVGAGGAIVLDSDPVEEYEEMLLKAEAPARALRASGSRPAAHDDEDGRDSR